MVGRAIFIGNGGNTGMILLKNCLFSGNCRLEAGSKDNTALDIAVASIAKMDAICW